jgi:hypothetical protein
MLAGALKDVPVEGDTRETEGGLFVAVTLIDAAAEDDEAPLLSVALADNE